jgi:hypothetical protein
LVAITNKVLKIEPQRKIENRVRLDAEVTFKASAHDNSHTGKICWLVNGDKQEIQGDTLSYRFICSGKYKIKAYIPQLLPFISPKESEYTLEVHKNNVTSLSVNHTTISAGDAILLTATTWFNDLLTGGDEDIIWKIKPPETSDQKVNKEAINFPDCQIDGDALIVRTPSHRGKILSVQLRMAGVYSITACMKGRKECSPVTVNAEKAQIQDWTFRDLFKQQRSQVGWKQDFTIYANIPALAGREAKVNLWFDKMDKDTEHKDRFVLLNVKELSQKQPFNSNGRMEVKIPANSSLWDELGKLKYKKEANLFFTISNLSALFTNHRLAIYNSDFEQIKGHFFPEQTNYTYLQVAYKTIYSGRFTDDSGEQIKHIIRYGDPVNAVFYVMHGKADKPEKEKKYFFRLYENKRGDDTALVTSDDFIPNSDGCVKIPLNTNNSGKGIMQSAHPADTPFLPRLFYYCIYDNKEDADKNKNAIFTYPERYGTGKDNDKYTRVDMKSDASVQDVEKELDENLDGFFVKDNRYNYYLQLKIAKETTLNKSIGQAAVKIGVPWGRNVKECKECVCKKYNFAWSKKINCEERKKVLEVCADLWGEENKVEKASQLMSIMDLETGGKFSPSINNGIGYVGLIQFGSAAAKAIGTTQEKLVQMTFIEQMDYVKKYLASKKDKLTTIVDLYLLVLKPNTVGSGNDSNYIIFDESIEVPNTDNKDNLWRDPWVKKYGYASNPIFMKEKGEKTKRMHIRNNGVKKEMYGFIGGKTYVWEIKQQLMQNHYNVGLSQKFSGTCISENDSTTNNKAPWINYAFQEYEKYNTYNASDQILKNRIDKYSCTKTNGGYYTGWCAAFVHWCFSNVVKYKETNVSGWAFAYDWLTPMLSKQQGKGNGWPNGEESEAFVGALIIFNYSHIAFIIGQTEDKKSYVYLGGNQGGAGPGKRKITKNSIKKNAGTFWIMKPKDYIPTQKEKELPILNKIDTKISNYGSTH